MPLTVEERHHVLRELREQEAALREATQIWDRTTPVGAWTVAEICEPLDKAERQISGLIQSPLLYSDQLPPSTWEDQTLSSRVSQKGCVAQSLAACRVFRKKMYTWIETIEAPLRNGRFEHPMLGVSDGYQWLLFVAAHGRRHTAQILERGQ